MDLLFSKIYRHKSTSFRSAIWINRRINYKYNNTKEKSVQVSLLFLYNTFGMDDKEYYSLMNRGASWGLQQVLKKKPAAKGKTSTKKEPFADTDRQTYASLELRQGKADAEMLMEKQTSQQ